MCVHNKIGEISSILKIQNKKMKKITILNFLYVKGEYVVVLLAKEGAEFVIEKCPVGAEFGGQNINFLMEVFCAIILKLEVICYHSKNHF